MTRGSSLPMDAFLAARMLGAFAIIAIVLFGLQYIARAGLHRRLAAQGGRRLVTIVETTYLPSASSLHVVKIGEEYAVIGRSANYIAKLADVPSETVDGWFAAQTAGPLARRQLINFMARLRRGGTPT
jgi:flagellar biogenesis protein FliO